MYYYYYYYHPACIFLISIHLYISIAFVFVLFLFFEEKKHNYDKIYNNISLVANKALVINKFVSEDLIHFLFC